MKEKWEHIKGYEGLYKVSDCGRVASLPHVVHKGFCTVMTSLVILTPKDNSNGYLFVSLSRGSKDSIKNKYIHRLVAETFIPNPCNKKEVDHIDGDRKNNNATNLRWVTRHENVWNVNTVGKNSKGVQIIERNSGNVIGVYPSMTKASTSLGISLSTLSWAKNNPKSTFKYIIKET